MNLISEESSREIFELLMKDVDENTFDLILERGSIQFLYENIRVHLINKYFDGDVLRFSIEMVRLFEPYNKDVLRLSELLHSFINPLKEKIRRSKKYNGNKVLLEEMIYEHNQYVSEFNQKSKLLRKLINKMYKQNEGATKTKINN